MIKKLDLYRTRALREWYVAKEKLNPIATVCKAKCSACCHWPIAIAPLEGMLIYQWLVEKKMWNNTLLEKLKQVAVSKQTLTYDVWRTLDEPCVFLAANLCTIYPVRPLVCRLACSYDASRCPTYAKGPMVSTQSVMEYHVGQEQLLKKYRVPMGTLPIASAVLVAHRVENGDSFTNAIYQVLK